MVWDRPSTSSLALPQRRTTADQAKGMGYYGEELLRSSPYHRDYSYSQAVLLRLEIFNSFKCNSYGKNACKESGCKKARCKEDGFQKGFF